MGSHESEIDELSWRVGARALIVDDESGDVLLVRFEFPTAVVWSTPGGGLEPGEATIDGLRRELREELGLVRCEIGPHIWSRELRFPMTTGHDGQRDQIFLVRCPRFEPAPEIGWEQLQAEFVHEIRWWTVAEIQAASRDVTLAGEDRPTLFAPRRLGDLVAQLGTSGPPATPIDTGA
jgi:ADP-ribose pyrophosphatase YjhB (NUDIX family)